MTQGHRDQLITFVLRMGMFIRPIDRPNIESFVVGFEFCSKGKCRFLHLMIELLEQKYRIAYLTNGWRGQIEKLAKRRHDSWVFTFRKVAMEVLTSDGELLNVKTQKFLKYDIDAQVEIIERLDKELIPQSAIEHWLTFTFLNCEWAKEMWTATEWRLINQIDKKVRLAKRRQYDLNFKSA